VKTEKDSRRLVGLEFSEDDASRGSGGHRRVLVGLRRPLLLHHHSLISCFVLLTTLFSLARREGVLEEGVRRNKKKKKGIIDISCIKNHVQVTCVRHRERLMMEMDGGGEIERN
jgi:hypothetical protein